jgi:hypothetical protein
MNKKFLLTHYIKSILSAVVLIEQKREMGSLKKLGQPATS